MKLSKAMKCWHDASNRNWHQPNLTMNASNFIPSIFVPSGATALAIYFAASSSGTAGLPVDVILASVTSAALVGFALKDYSRRLRPLAPKAPVVHLAAKAPRHRAGNDDCRHPAMARHAA